MRFFLLMLLVLLDVVVEKVIDSVGGAVDHALKQIVVLGRDHAGAILFNDAPERGDVIILSTLQHLNDVGKFLRGIRQATLTWASFPSLTAMPDTGVEKLESGRASPPSS